MIVWLTGQPGAGKTTIADCSREIIENMQPQLSVAQVDGDDLRSLLSNPGYGESGRRTNIDRAQAIAAYLDEVAGYDVVLVSLVAPYRDQRDEFKGDHDVIEAYVHTNEMRGREGYHVEGYERPGGVFIDIDTTNESVTQSSGRVYRALAAVASWPRVADSPEA